MTANNMNGMMNNFSQLFSQGVQMNQQQGQHNERMDKQQQQLDMMQRKYDDVVKRQFRDDWNKSLFEGDYYGNWNRVEQFMASHPEEFGDQKLRGASDSDIFEGHMVDGHASVSPSTRANYFQDTGIQLPSEDDAALKILRRSAMIDDANGTNWVNPQSLSMGLSNYKTYKDETMRSMGGSKVDPLQRASELRTKINAVGWANMSEQERSDYDVYSQKSGTGKQWAIQDLAFGGQDGKGMFQDQTDLVSGKNWMVENIDPKAKQRMFAMQHQAGYSYPDTAAKLRSTEIGQVRTMKRVSDKLAELDATSQGEVENYMSQWAARANSEDWDKMSKSAQDVVLADIKKNTVTQGAAARIVADISGATVPEEEQERWNKILFAGGANKVGYQALQTAIATNLDEFYETAKGTIQGIDSNKYGYNKLDYAEQLETAYNGGVDIGSKPNADKSVVDEISGAARETQKDITQQGVGEAKKTFTDVVDTVFDNPGEPQESGDEDLNWFEKQYGNVKEKYYETFYGYSPKAIRAAHENDGVTKENAHTPKSQVIYRVNDSSQRAVDIRKFDASLNGKSLDELEKMLTAEKDPTRRTRIAFKYQREALK